MQLVSTFADVYFKDVSAPLESKGYSYKAYILPSCPRLQRPSGPNVSQFAWVELQIGSPFKDWYKSKWGPNN